MTTAEMLRSMTSAELLRSEAFREGYAEGCAEVLVGVLTFRFGPLPPAALEKIQAACLDQLKGWTAPAVTAETLDDVLC